MSFTVQCYNKECRKITDLLIDEKTNEAVCADCFSPIPNISDITKNQLRMNKKFKRAASDKQSFGIRCNSCTLTCTPTVKEGKAFCGNCKEEIKVTPGFINLLKLRDNNNL